VVGLTRFDRLALGAATAPPKARSSSSATGWSGTRSPTVARPAVTSGQIDAAFGTTSVNGPGHHTAARVWAASDQVPAYRLAVSIFATCAMSGLVGGRPLAAKILRTASGFVASAPRP
jgi:hypothetical protein